MISKFVKQNEDDFQQAMERIQEHQEIEDSSLIMTFELFRDTVTILFQIKLNHASFDKILMINNNKESKYIFEN